jgi:hypothetical protein
LAGHEVTTVSGQGWQGLKNGELFRRALGAGIALILSQISQFVGEFDSWS